MEPKIVFEDKHILILEKPSGWIVNEAQTTKGQKVLQTWITKNVKSQISDKRLYRSGIVHRLDKETSGVLVVAKTIESFEYLQKQFKERKVKKTYTALVHGSVEPKEGIIKAPVGRLPWNRERFGVVPGGRSATTFYKVVDFISLPTTLSEPDGSPSRRHFSLLELYPKTGRTHQIRVHLKHLGHPVVSDEFYAGRKRAREDRKWCPRLFLHASGISFKHPEVKEVVSYVSLLPKDLNGALSRLEIIE
jgi:23S rRNA pseudouridine1911/1915/1917 synthase